MGEKGPVVMAEHVMDSWEGGVLAQLASCAESAESAEKRKSTWRECSHGIMLGKCLEWTLTVIFGIGREG
jgi:hypothetical protein